MKLWAILVAVGLTGTQAHAQIIDYLRQVKPILSGKCYACHGSLKQEAGLRLDTAALVRQGGESGVAVDVTDPSSSLLLQRVLEPSDELRMPPAGEGERLTAEQQATLWAWIEQGAIGPDEPIPTGPRDHWAYQPIKRPRVPSVDTADEASAESTNPIDAFLAVHQRTLGVSPAPLADRATLIRRVYLDLIGLPPTRSELRAFLADTNPLAYERRVEELLERPQYAERWARHWMDVWRYSDWAGFGEEIRYSQRNLWHWRDWIIESLRADKGYDEMVLEMLAADELQPDNLSAQRATGFLARNWYKFDRHVWLDDTVEHTGRAFLGITMRCARCHDHKYDPVSQADYYRMRAIFEPYEVRTDAGRDGIAAMGVPRVYDANPEAVTALFLRGDPKRPAPDQKMLPGIPAFLGTMTEPAPKNLPPVSFYPATSKFAQAEAMRQVEQAVADATSALKALEDRKSGNATKLEDERAEQSVLELKLAAAQAARSSLLARIEAELHKYAASEANLASCAEDDSAVSVSRSATEVSQQAARAERQAKLLAAQVELAELEEKHRQATSKSTSASDDGQSQQVLTELTAQLQAAREKVEQARKTAAEDSVSYEPLGTIYPTTTSGRRTALARWIVDRQNPLTARVGVNHIWMRHFGSPLIESMDDLGLRTERPMQADLLDYLCCEWIDHGWSMKHLHRLIVTSAAYRRASHAPESAQLDPDNRAYGRMNALRMTAETVRDAILATSGQLDVTMSGPDLNHEEGMTTYRRSLYYRHSHEKQMLFLQTFDAANPRECYQREVSIRPQQALAMINSSLTLQQSRRLAAQLTQELRGDTSAATDGAFIEAAFETILARAPRESELAACDAYLRRLATQLETPEQLNLLGSDAGRAASESPRQRARENLVLSLFSHHDFITIH